MKIICVVPSIRPAQMESFRKAWAPLFEKHQVTLVTVWDGEEPEIAWEDYSPFKQDPGEYPRKKFKSSGGSSHVLKSPRFTDYRDLFCRFTDACRNIGFVKAAELGADYILTLDDDVEPVGDPIQGHLDALDKRVPISWMNTAHDTNLYLRGFPYSIRDEAPVMLSHGVWVGTPDFDGETQLRLEQTSGVPNSLPYYVGPIPKGVLFPLCFVPTTEVTMADGSRKAIADVNVEERVFSKGGESHRVIRVVETKHNGPVVKLRVAGRDRDVVCTENHPMLALRCGSDKPEWLTASCITLDDKLATPVIREPGELTPPNLSMCKLLGYFLAEGNYDKYSPKAQHSKAGQYHGLKFTFGTEKKQDAIRDCCECLTNLGIEYRLEHPKESATVVATKTCYDLVALLRDTYCVGEWAHGKRLPIGVYRWGVSSKRALLAAYWAGDGCFSTVERIKGTTQYQCQAKTRSRTMAVQIQLLMQSLGFTASVARLSPYKHSKEAWAVSINGGRAREFKTFLTEGTLPANGKRKFDKAFCDGQYHYYSVKEISRVKYEGPVYNLTVEDDHSYLVEGLVAKNCGMNVMIRREALPYFYFAPMGPDTGVGRRYKVCGACGSACGRENVAGDMRCGDCDDRYATDIEKVVPLLHRFADIFMGMTLKLAFDRLDWACYTGASTVLHTRASDARKNVWQEKLGREWIEALQTSVKDVPIESLPVGMVQYFDSYRDKCDRYTQLIHGILEGKK